VPEDGMDVVAVRDIATKLDSEAAHLSGVIAAIDGAVTRLPGIWVGKDSSEFVGWWQHQHRPAIQKVHDSIAGLAVSARNNAADQEQASGGSSQGPAAATGPIVRSLPAMPNANPDLMPRLGKFVVDHPQGSYVNGYGYSGTECVGVFHAYNREVVGADKDFWLGNDGGARGYYERFDELGMGSYYEKLPPSTAPQAGDVVIWGGNVGHGYGHVAVVSEVSGGSVTIVEQNVSAHDAFGTSAMWGKESVIGYLRPRSL